MNYMEAAQIAYETPPDDEPEEAKHSPYCRCDDCEAYAADCWYDSVRDDRD